VGNPDSRTYRCQRPDDHDHPVTDGEGG